MGRLFGAGDFGSGLVIRAAKPGGDVLTGTLDDFLFDSSALPTKKLGGGEFTAGFNGFQQTQPNVPQQTTQAHGIGTGTIAAMFFIGKPLAGRSGDGIWAFWYRSSATVVSSQSLGNGNMNNQYCTPFKFSGDFGTGLTYWGGFWCSFDQTNIYVQNNLANQVSVKWVALEL